MKQFDVVVIGTGTAGQTAAMDLAAEGYKVAVVEKSNEPGGVCALRGCQAKKWFYEAAETVARCKHLLRKGIEDIPGVSWEKIHAEKNKFTAKIPENTVKNIKGNGIDYIEGEAVFKNKSSLSVSGNDIQAAYYIIATGASPMSLPIKGSEHIITSNDFLALEHLPERIAFIGGGFISFEFAHFAARLGGKPGHLFILEANDRVLGPFDADMVEALVNASEEEGIRIKTDVEIVEVEKSGIGFRIVTDSDGDFEVDLVVNGAGRRANVESLNLDSAGVAYSKNGIEVDEHLQTSNKNIFAVGDCAATMQLARVADMEGKIAAKAIVAAKEEGEMESMDYTTVPAVLFSYPQLGMVGKTEEQLQSEEIRYWKSSEKNVGWPTYTRVGLDHAAYKILVDENEKIVGAHFLSDNVTGMVNTFVQAMRNDMTVQELHASSILSPYPSRESDIIYMLSQFVE